MVGDERFVRIDLVRYAAVRLNLLCFLQGDEQAESIFSDLLRSGRFFSVTKYRRSKVPHLLVEQVEKTAGEDSRLIVQIDYSADDEIPSERVPREYRREGELISRLNELSGPVKIDCRADFMFDVPDERSSAMGQWFPLPMSVNSNPKGIEGPIDEIRGIRGVKLKKGTDENGVEYSFILDRPGTGPVILSVDFELFEQITNETPVNAIHFARDVAARIGFFSR